MKNRGKTMRQTVVMGWVKARRGLYLALRHLERGGVCREAAGLVNLWALIRRSPSVCACAEKGLPAIHLCYCSLRF